MPCAGKQAATKLWGSTGFWCKHAMPVLRYMQALGWFSAGVSLLIFKTLNTAG